MDPAILREVERIFIACGAVVFGILGYRLFIFGKTEGQTHLSVESKLLKAVFSGTAPGLFFMLCGATILAILVMKGGVTSRDGTKIERLPLDDPAPYADAIIKDLETERSWLLYNERSTHVDGGGGSANRTTDPVKDELRVRQYQLEQMHRERYDRLLIALKTLPGYHVPEKYRSGLTVTPTATP